MRNLLDETVKVLEENGKVIQNVKHVQTNDSYFLWGEFAELAKSTSYCSGYGRTEINADLKVVGEDFWLERHECDGFEWWEFKAMPERPTKMQAPKSLERVTSGGFGFMELE